jgi:hypothetical protein
MRTVYIIFIFLLLFSCEWPYMDRIDPLYIKNQSNCTISIYPARRGIDFVYPDTSITLKYKPYPLGSFLSTNFASADWKEEIEFLPKDTLSIFIFSTDTLNKYSWEEVRRDYKILKRYELSYEDCKLLKFRVPYPPTPAMSRMKMYPKYGR